MEQMYQNNNSKVKHTPARKQAGSKGYSLAEVMISMFLLTLFTLALFKALIYTQYTAEDNLYEATALTVAISMVEQMKGASMELLETPPKQDGKEVFNMIVEGGQKRNVTLGQENILLIPIVTENDGSITKRMELTVTPSIVKMTGMEGFWLRVQYSYKHPRSELIRTEVIRNARSSVPTS